MEIINNTIDKLLFEENNRNNVIISILSNLNERLKNDYYITWDCKNYSEHDAFILNRKQYLFFVFETPVASHIDKALFKNDYINNIINNPSNFNIEKFVERLFFKLNLSSYLKHGD